ncbi:MAG: hydrolase, partial [Paenibacillus sp.]|nr:hydrolase [Paenibacillus sp.]
MKTTANKRIGQAVLTVGLSFTVLLAGSAFLTSSTVQAAPGRDTGWNFGWNQEWNYDWNTDNGSSSGSGNESGTGSSADSESGTSISSDIISKGKQYIGVPYKFGAKTGNTKSFDCSSFTQYLYGLSDIAIPRESIEQSRAGTYVPRSQLKPGDLVFFYSPVHHVAIYIGDGKILHTYGDPGVTITDLDSGWWDEHYTTARRV